MNRGIIFDGTINQQVRLVLSPIAYEMERRLVNVCLLGSEELIGVLVICATSYLLVIISTKHTNEIPAALTLSPLFPLVVCG